MSKPKLAWPPPKSRTFNLAYAPQAFNLNQEVLTKSDLDEWYDEHIKPLGEGVEVFGNNGGVWDIEADYLGNDTQRALIIGVEPLKEKTAEDVLREMVEALDDPDYNCDNYNDIIRKGRIYLAKRDGK